MIITILDTLASFLIMVGILKVVNNYKYWLAYVAGSLSFTLVAIFGEDIRWASVVMGLITMGLGIKNYITERRKNGRKV